MLSEISLNILDVAQNSIRAGATVIVIEVVTDTKEDRLSVLIQDNGCGMDETQLEHVTDPFYTTRKTRKVGLGLPFLKQEAEAADGSFEIASHTGEGTSVKAVFGLSHTNRMPLGDINTTIYQLIIFNDSIDFRYRYAYDEREFTLDTKEIRKILDGLPINHPDVTQFIREYLEENTAEVNDGNTL